MIRRDAELSILEHPVPDLPSADLTLQQFVQVHAEPGVFASGVVLSKGKSRQHLVHQPVKAIDEAVGLDLQ